MKKITPLIAVALIVTSMSSTAFAASSVDTTSLKAQTSAVYANCLVNGCNATGTHDHNGTTYFSHHNGDGHTYHTNSQQLNKTDGHGNHKKSGGHH